MRSLQGLLLGLIAGVVDCGIYSIMGVSITNYDVATALTFWSVTGWLIHVTELGVPNILKGILIALALNVPWAINFVGLGVGGEMLPFILALGLVFGSLLGVISSKNLLQKT